MQSVSLSFSWYIGMFNFFLRILIAFCFSQFIYKYCKVRFLKFGLTVNVIIECTVVILIVDQFQLISSFLFELSHCPNSFYFFYFYFFWLLIFSFFQSIYSLFVNYTFLFVNEFHAY